MARPREHLRNAPIAEAVVDFRVRCAPTISAASFSDLRSLIGERYSQPELIQSFEAIFGIANGVEIGPSQRREALGWKYQFGTEIAQFRINGFTFSKIEPYTTWGEVFGEAIRLWKIYKEVASPLQLSRVAVRYVNRMRIEGGGDVGDILVAPPRLPQPVQPAYLDFLSRVHITDTTRALKAIIVQALEPRVDTNVMSILLDIDAYHEGMIPLDGSELSALFERLRQMKNEIFYASITEQAAERYE